MHNHLVFDQLDERHKEVAVQPVFIKVIRYPVRRGHHHHARRKQPFKKPPHKHRVCDVGDLHFIKGQQPHRRRHISGNRGDGVIHPGFAHLVHGGVDFLHEGVKMHPARRHIAQTVHKEVHQHGFPTPHTAPKIEAFGWFGRFAEKPFFDRRQQRVADAVKLRQHRLLRGVRLQRSVGNEGIICRAQALHEP